MMQTEVYHDILGGYVIKAQSLSAVAPCGGVRSDVLVRIMTRLKGSSGDQRLLFPKTHKPIGAKQCPLTFLRELGLRGPVHRDITGKINAKSNGEPRGPFDRAKWEPDSEYPMLWEHEASKETRLIVQPDSQGRIRSGLSEEAVDLWDNYATRLHMNLDFRLNSQPLAACFTDAKSIGGRAWPNYVLGEQKTDREGNPTEFRHHPEWEIPILLWMNTIIGLMSFWWTAARSQTPGRANLTITTLGAIPCLDVRMLNKGQLELCDRIFDDFRDAEFKPANEAYRDKVRQSLDREILHTVLGIDDALLGRDYLGLLRNQWCREPSVHGGKETKPLDV